MKSVHFRPSALPLAVALAFGTPLALAQSPCTPRATRAPCAARNPCAAKQSPCRANPCAAKKSPCAARNPCAAKSPCAAKGPCGAKSPCGAGDKVDPKLVMRPKGYQPAKGDLARGEELWKSTKLSTNGLACATCHVGGTAAFSPSFAKPYPHAVAMATEKGGVKQVHLDEMVQFCMVVPMAAKPLPWGSKDLASLTAYSAEVQKRFIKTGAATKAASPCAARSPCAAKNPCAAKRNPCGANPCAAKRNPCGANPCAAKRK